VTGRGVTGSWGPQKLALGSHALLVELGVPEHALDDQAAKLREAGKSVVALAVDKRLVGVIGITDPVKLTTREAIQLLHEDGVRIVMATGDNKGTAQRVAQELGIDEVVAEVLPEDKLALIERLKKEGRRVAMAGDGVNDAPALARADASIAMGTGSDVALQSAQVTLLKGDLRGIAKARLLSRATMQNIRQNLFFAFVYNVAGVPLAAGLLYPMFGILLSPMIASAAMSLSSVSVIGNALRLRNAEL
jgi:Cu+-exporting ATPase